MSDTSKTKSTDKSTDKPASDSCCGCKTVTKKNPAPQAPTKKPAGNLPKR